jgi:hypothetical protein
LFLRQPRNCSGESIMHKNWLFPGALGLKGLRMSHKTAAEDSFVRPVCHAIGETLLHCTNSVSSSMEQLIAVLSCR